MVVSNIFYFHPYLGKIPILTNIFQIGLKPPTRNYPLLHQFSPGFLSPHLFLGEAVEPRMIRTPEKKPSFLRAKDPQKAGSVNGAFGCLLGGGNSNIFNVHPENWGR